MDMSDTNHKMTYAGIEVGIRDDGSIGVAGFEIILFEIGPCVITLDIDTENGEYGWCVTDTATGGTDYFDTLAEALADAKKTTDWYENTDDDEAQ